MSSIDAKGRPVAYKDEAFLDSDDARPLRILSEYLAPMNAFKRERIADSGVEVSELGVKDVILPGEIRELGRQ